MRSCFGSQRISNSEAVAVTVVAQSRRNADRAGAWQDVMPADK